ncbi:hypothetical protein [Brevundimonas lutea]|uniref:hypothetical protein n=1 Tax=Brevundimonas lutea TaxID=2293980 RepID=UPI001F0BFE1C|nr:hypothetical protein [Brevundimonas lutea]
MLQPPTPPQEMLQAGPRPEDSYPLPISWEDIEVVLEDMAPETAKPLAVEMVRNLRMVSWALSPMDLLQQVILTAQAVSTPEPISPGAWVHAFKEPPTEILPRLHWDDIETVLHHSTSGKARSAAMAQFSRIFQERHLFSRTRDMLRVLFSLVFALPRARLRRTNPSPPERRRAA